MTDLICFEVNDWHEYPKFFDEWFDHPNGIHSGENWLIDLDAYAKENKICIKIHTLDMAASLLVTAPKKWVEDNIPEFKEEWWQDRCVYKYPWPYLNDCKYHPFSGFTLEDSPKKHLEERDYQLWHLKHYYTEEDIENFKPHNIMGCPSCEPFLDYEEKNFGAIEVLTGEDDVIETIWRVVDGKITKEDCGIKKQEEIENEEEN